MIEHHPPLTTIAYSEVAMTRRLKGMNCPSASRFYGSGKEKWRPTRFVFKAEKADRYAASANGGVAATPTAARANSGEDVAR